MEASPQPQPSPATEIVFFDVETTVPSRAVGTSYALLEFGAVVVCPRRLVEVGSYSTLIRPADTALITPISVRCNGITPDAVANAPFFCDVASNVYSVLNGRVWAGHNIARFDCPQIREAFAEIGQPAPEPKGLIDTLPLLTQRFGRRAGNMKESSLPHMYSIYEDTTTRGQVNGNTSFEGTSVCMNSPTDFFSIQNKSLANIETIMDANEYDTAGSSTLEPSCDPSDVIRHIEQIQINPSQTNGTLGRLSHTSPEILAPYEDPSAYNGFLEPCEVSTQYISAPQVPFYHCGHQIILLHRDAPLQLCCSGLRVRFGISTRFVDNVGRPKLSIVVDVPETICRILDACDHLARRSTLDSGSRSEWRQVVKKNNYSDSSSVRLNIPTAANREEGIYSTEICQKEQSGNTQKLVFSGLDTARLDLLFVPGTVVDAYFSFDVYDYQNSAGIRLVAKRLVVPVK